MSYCGNKSKSITYKKVNSLGVNFHTGNIGQEEVIISDSFGKLPRRLFFFNGSQSD